jgi:hypothetical protein
MGSRSVRPAACRAEFVVEDGEQQQQLLDHLRGSPGGAVAVVAQDLVDVGLRFLGAPEVLQALVMWASARRCPERTALKSFQLTILTLKVLLSWRVRASNSAHAGDVIDLEQLEPGLDGLAGLLRM